METIIIATKNKGKVKEFAHMFSKKGIQVKSLLDFEKDIEIEETGITFQENAAIKAEAISSLINKVVIADDSGLVVDALEGRPGVYSARYAGEEKNDQANLEKVLEELKGVPYEQRTARFVCALAVAIPNQKTEIVEGKCEGMITEEPKGEKGFGYDPIFYVPLKEKTMAEMDGEEKNTLSHRAQALHELEKEWDRLLKQK
ncbi:XTP/dITP diphosphatase [Bacillus taeanensis]|uniref:dITP/XTP pyrophosphatase n=1 Tax=Bacillus taeanensis TaxID=273032 RepID=A0A366Y138_9BACI|nr:XTP/dITP diphosphatase [Bacillus taeanensis]RBW71556.1 non-canonical purine NTP pyrophosphatase [Bacillus taeanensis]